MSNANQSHSDRNFAQQQHGKDKIDAGIASGNTLPGGFQAIATAYGDYTKKSFEDTKSFVEEALGREVVREGDRGSNRIREDRLRNIRH